jgi:hypothetical protein
MGVVYIGDRFTGKTHLAMELANPRYESVMVSSPANYYEELQSLLLNESGVMRPTDASIATDFRNLEVKVKLNRWKTLQVDWVDTPGEVWRKSWQTDNTDEWHRFLQVVKQSEGIVLLLPPYRNILPQTGIDRLEFMTRMQWCNRFKLWANFFTKECSHVQRIAICLNKADLFCDVEQESVTLGRKNWHERHAYVCQKFLAPMRPQIESLERQMTRTSIACFITSIHQRQLLELPWLYLGTYLPDSSM